MELDWARNQSQKARSIEPGRNIGGEDLYKEKKNLANSRNEISKRVNTLEMPQEAT